MKNIENKFRLIAFVPIGYIANLSVIMLLILIPGFVFFGWLDPYIIDPELPVEQLFNISIEPPVELPISQEKLFNIVLILEVPCSVLGYKVSHLIKPANLTNKNFIKIHFLIIGLSFAYHIGLIGGSISNLNPFISFLIEVGVFTLMIKDRRFNLFNMGDK